MIIMSSDLSTTSVFVNTVQRMCRLFIGDVRRNERKGRKSLTVTGENQSIAFQKKRYDKAILLSMNETPGMLRLEITHDHCLYHGDEFKVL